MRQNECRYLQQAGSCAKGIGRIGYSPTLYRLFFAATGLFPSATLLFVLRYPLIRG